MNDDGANICFFMSWFVYEITKQVDIFSKIFWTSEKPTFFFQRILYRIALAADENLGWEG